MPTSSAVVHALTACAAVTMFAGCSAGNPHVAAPPLVPLDGAASQSIQQQGLPTGRRKDDLLGSGGTKLLAQSATRSFFDPAATGRPLIFAGDYNKSVINIYSQAKGNAMVGQIVGAIYGPIGLATDTSGDVYIANEVSATVSVFAPPYTKRPKLTLDDVGNTAYDVAVSTQGLVAVANFNGSVNIYRKNSTEPCVTVSDPSFGGVLHDVFDDQGNLYIDGGHVGVIRGGCRATTIEMLSTGNVIGLIAGIK